MKNEDDFVVFDDNLGSLRVLRETDFDSFFTIGRHRSLNVFDISESYFDSAKGTSGKNSYTIVFSKRLQKTWKKFIELLLALI